VVVGDQGSYMEAWYFGEPREISPEGTSERQALPGDGSGVASSLMAW